MAKVRKYEQYSMVLALILVTLMLHQLQVSLPPRRDLTERSDTVEFILPTERTFNATPQTRTKHHLQTQDKHQQESQANQQKEYQANQQKAAQENQQNESQSKKQKKAKANKQEEARAKQQQETQGNQQKEDKANNKKMAKANMQKEAQESKHIEEQANQQNEAQPIQQQDPQANLQKEAQTHQQLEPQAHQQLEPQAHQQQQLISGNQSAYLTTVPMTVYMLWDSGWSNAPLIQKICLQSFQRYNPDFNIRALDLLEAETLINRRQYYSDAAWANATIQAKSDIIRLEVLASLGGVWADATVYCNEPLSGWLTDVELSASFIAYRIPDTKVNRRFRPRISSWFLAATRDSKLVQAWRLAVRRAWDQAPYPTSTAGYFWVHHIFRKLVLSSPEFQAWFALTPFMNSDGPHCNDQINGMSQEHMFKLTSKNCSGIKRKLMKTG